MVEIEQRVLTEFGELRHKPLANQSIAIGLDGGCEVLHEGVFPQITFTLGQSGDELLHAVIGQVLELITVELLAALGGVVGGRLVGLPCDGQIGEVRAELGNQLVFIALGVIHHLCELGGDSQGLGDNIKRELFHGNYLSFLCVAG